MNQRCDVPAHRAGSPRRRGWVGPLYPSASSPPPDLSVDVLAPDEVEKDGLLLEEWAHRVEDSAAIYRLYQSPGWWGHLRATQGDDALRLIVIRSSATGICGVVPCHLRLHRVKRQVAGRVVTMARGWGVDLLGSEPLVDAHPDVYMALVGSLWRVFSGIEICRLKSLSTSSAFWRFLHEGSERSAASLTVTDGARRPFYSIDLTAGWTGYLSRFNAKQRNDLQRKQRVMAQALGAEVTVRRLTTPDDVQAAYADLSQVATRARQRTGRALPDQPRLVDAAQRGLLRAYVLHAGASALAYVIGYQGQNVFHYSDVAFSDDAARLSPGTVLLYHVIRDVCEHRPASWFNFGLGEAEYKRRFCNVKSEDATVYVMRRTLRNHLRVLSLKSIDILRQLHTVGWAIPPAVSRAR